MTCSIATEPRRIRSFPHSKVYRVHLRKYPLQNPTRSFRSGQWLTNDRCLLVEPEAGPLSTLMTSSHVLTCKRRYQLLYSSAWWTTGWRTAALCCAFWNSGPRRWRLRASDLLLMCGPSRWMPRSNCRPSRTGPSHAALIGSDRSCRGTIRRNSCRASHASRGRIMRSCWLVRKEYARRIAG
jgi:hypothetical protein